MPTKEINSADAIQTLSTGEVEVDFSRLVAGWFREEWNTANSGTPKVKNPSDPADYSKPAVDFVEQFQGVDFGDRDVISVADVSGVVKPVAVTYQFTNETALVQLDFYSASSRAHSIDLVNEARRIIMGHRKDPLGVGNISGRIWIEWGVNVVSHGRTRRKHFRKTVDIRFNWRFRVIE